MDTVTPVWTAAEPGNDCRNPENYPLDNADHNSDEPAD